MTCTVFKNGRAWNFLATNFKMQSYSFQRVVKIFVEMTGPQAYKIFVANKVQFYKMTQLCSKDILFVHYPKALYAADVIFQQENWPSGRIEERKV